MTSLSATKSGFIKLLAKYGADIELLVEDKTALMRASYSDCYVDALKQLLDLGANPNAANQSAETPLIYAVTPKNTKATKILLSAGADINHPTKSGWPPLFFAVGNSKYNVEIMNILISAGTNINATANDGSTPLSSAIEENAIEAVKVLLANDANPYYTNPSTGEKISVLTLDNDSRPARKAIFDLIRNWLENKALNQHIHASENLSILSF